MFLRVGSRERAGAPVTSFPASFRILRTNYLSPGKEHEPPEEEEEEEATFYPAFLSLDREMKLPRGAQIAILSGRIKPTLRLDVNPYRGMI